MYMQSFTPEGFFTFIAESAAEIFALWKSDFKRRACEHDLWHH